MFSAPVYKTYGGIIASEKFEPVGFKLPLGFKDNRLLLAAAEEASVPMPMASLMHARFVAALAQGLEKTRTGPQSPVSPTGMPDCEIGKLGQCIEGYMDLQLVDKRAD